jgi:hypothetical protein
MRSSVEALMAGDSQFEQTSTSAVHPAEALINVADPRRRRPLADTITPVSVLRSSRAADLETSRSRELLEKGSRAVSPKCIVSSRGPEETFRSPLEKEMGGTSDEFILRGQMKRSSRSWCERAKSAAAASRRVPRPRSSGAGLPTRSRDVVRSWS